MDRKVIEQKLESLRHCLQRVADKCPPEAETLGHDPACFVRESLGE